MFHFADTSLVISEALRVTPVEGEFVPFRRTDVVLSPSHAQEAAPISRELTQVAQAREAYFKTMQPAQYGIHMHNIKDTIPRAAVPIDHSKVCLFFNRNTCVKYIIVCFIIFKMYM